MPAGKPTGKRIAPIARQRKKKSGTKVVDISNHLQNLTPTGAKAIGNVLPKNSAVRRAYTGAFEIQEAIKKGNNLGRMDPKNLEEHLQNPFLARVDAKTPEGQVVRGQEAYNLVERALGTARERKALEERIGPKLQELSKTTPLGMERRRWDRMLRNLKEKALRKK